MAANGRLTASVVRHPPTSTSSPPSGGPITATVLRRDGEDGEHAGGAVLTGALGLVPDQPHGRRVAAAGAEAENDPRHDQHGEVRCEGADHPREAHQCRRREEQTARAVEVDQPADDRLADGGGQVQRRDEPGRRRRRRPEGHTDRHQGDGDDRGVDRVEHRAGDQRREQPAVESGGPAASGRAQFSTTRSSRDSASSTTASSSSLKRCANASLSHSARCARAPSA